jgi:hypothetical protein
MTADSAFCLLTGQSGENRVQKGALMMEGEFDRLPYPITPLESEEAYEAIAEQEETIDVNKLLFDLQELIQDWRDTCCSERSSLSKTHEAAHLPLEFRAGLAQGLESAAADLERVMMGTRHRQGT